MTRTLSRESSSSDERSPLPEPRLEPIIIHMYVRRNDLSWANGLVNESIDVNQSFQEVINRLTGFAFDKLSLKSLDSSKCNITFGSKWGTGTTRIAPSNKKSTAPVDVNLFADLKRESSYEALVRTIRASIQGKRGVGNHILYLIALVTDAETSGTPERAVDNYVSLEDTPETSEREVLLHQKVKFRLILESYQFTAS
jgi:hypothetical protein